MKKERIDIGLGYVLKGVDTEVVRLVKRMYVC